MKTIKLSKGMFAMVDDADFDDVNRHRWHVLMAPGVARACRTYKRNGTKIHVYMHRQIIGALPGQIVDHANHDGLDNRRSNLRLCSKADNARNGYRRIRGKTAKFKGVCITSRRHTPSPWRATITVNGRQKSLGNYKTQDEAALAYDAAARSYFGEFANLNFPGENNV